MIANLKVTDGDLLLVHIDGDSGYNAVHDYREALTRWLRTRSLNNVELLITYGESKVTITKVTVNDVFEKEVLGK